jgi:hypothetical protein
MIHAVPISPRDERKGRLIIGTGCAGGKTAKGLGREEVFSAAGRRNRHRLKWMGVLWVV